MISNLFTFRESVPVAPWRCLFEQTRRFLGLMAKVPLIFSSSLTREVGLAAVSFMQFVFRLQRKSGYLFTALYLKQCGVCLQRYYAGSVSNTSLSLPVSLTRCGIPRVIPSVLRKAIRRRDAHGDFVVRLYGLV